MSKQFCKTGKSIVPVLIMLIPGSMGSLVHAASCPDSAVITADGCSLTDTIGPAFPYLDNEVSVSYMEKRNFIALSAKNHQGSVDSWLISDDTAGYLIDKPKYHLKARVVDETATGMLKIGGKIAGEKFRISASLNGEIDISGDRTRWQFNTTDTACSDLISARIGECETDEVVYLGLEEALDPDREHDRINTDGRSITDLPSTAVVPVPAAAWLFGSGLIALAGITRRWNA